MLQIQTSVFEVLLVKNFQTFNFITKIKFIIFYWKKGKLFYLLSFNKKFFNQKCQ